MKKFSILNFQFSIHNGGFTLIELLVVMSIIAILVASASASWRNAQMKGRDGKRKTDLKAVQQALENYFQVNGRYACFGADGSICGWAPASQLTVLVPTYIKTMPGDPSGDGCKYLISSNGSNYTFLTSLENVNDPDATGAKPSQSYFPPGNNNANITFTVTGGSCIGYTYNYWVISP